MWSLTCDEELGLYFKNNNNNNNNNSTCHNFFLIFERCFHSFAICTTGSAQLPQERFRDFQFPVECCKTKNKVITLTNHKTRWTNQNSKKIHVTGPDRALENTCEHANKSWLVPVLLLIGRESGTGFFANQPQSVEKTTNGKQKQNKQELHHSIENHSKFRR